MCVTCKIRTEEAVGFLLALSCNNHSGEANSQVRRTIKEPMEKPRGEELRLPANSCTGKPFWKHTLKPQSSPQMTAVLLDILTATSNSRLMETKMINVYCFMFWENLLCSSKHPIYALKRRVFPSLFTLSLDGRRACGAPSRILQMRATCWGRRSNNMDGVWALSGFTEQSQHNNSLAYLRGKSVAVVLKPKLPSVGPPGACKWVQGV